MNRWILPGTTVALVAAATALTMAVLPAAPPPEPEEPAVSTYLTAVCPSFESATAAVRVAVTSQTGMVTTAPLSNPEERNDDDGVSVLNDRPEPVLVSGETSSGLGAVSLSRSTSGPDRGLSAATCESAATQRWFTGVLLEDDAQADLELANADTIDAAVDVTIFGPEGRINAAGSRGIVVEAHSARSVPLSVLASVDGPVTLLVESSAGRVAATVRQRLWQGTTPLGADWVPPTAVPGTDLVIPGIVPGEGVRELVLTNPGERTTSVAVQLLGETGPGELPGTEGLDLPPGTTHSVELSTSLAGQLAGLRVRAEQPIIAGVRQASSGSAKKQDPAWTAALPALDAPGTWPVPAGAKATLTLLLSNPSANDAQVSVTVGNELGGIGETSPQVVPGGSTVAVPVPGAKTPWVRLEAAGTDVRGVLQVTESLGGVDGLALVPLLTPRRAGIEIPPVVFEPHAAR